MSSATLIPSSRYVVHADYLDTNGTTRTLARAVATSEPDARLRATFTNSGRVGFGEPLVVTFNHHVTGAAARAAVLKRLLVTTSPAVAGAWRFYNSYEAHYPVGIPTVAESNSGKRCTDKMMWTPPLVGYLSRPVETFRVRSTVPFLRTVMVWAVMSTVLMDPHAGGVDGAGAPCAGAGQVEPAQVCACRDRGARRPVAGRAASPDGYYEKLPYSMRISNGGAFVHANPATVSVQGRFNVSHGCVNLSVPDAKWFYQISSGATSSTSSTPSYNRYSGDEGMADWNYRWATWREGNLNG